MQAHAYWTWKPGQKTGHMLRRLGVCLEDLSIEIVEDRAEDTGACMEELDQAQILCLNR